MITPALLKPFNNGANLEVSNGTLILSNVQNTMANSVPVEDETLSFETLLSKEDVKKLKVLLKQTKSQAFIRFLEAESVTFTSGGIDLAITRAETDTTAIREVLRKFWSEKPPGAESIPFKLFESVKRVIPFVNHDEFRLNDVLVSGDHVVATNGSALISVDLKSNFSLQLPRQEAIFLSTWKLGLFYETDEHWILSNQRQSIVLRKDTVTPFPPWENVVPKTESLTPMPLTRTIRDLIVAAGSFPRDLGTPYFEMTCENGIITIEACLKTKRFKKDIEDFSINIDASLISTESKSIKSFSKDGHVCVFGIPRGKLILMGRKT